MANLLYIFNAKLSKKLYKGKYQLIACDGSTVEIFHNPNDPDTYYEPNGKSKKGYNHLHINAFYSILDRRFTNLVIQPGRKTNEYAAFCEMVDTVGASSSPIIYFADMGYASYNNYAHVIENGQLFLVRCNDLRASKILGSSVDHLREADITVDRILTRSHSKKIRSRPDYPEVYRHICSSVAFDYFCDEKTEYCISLRLVRFEISPGCFENIVTNLPDTEFDFEEFKSLYHLRWTEENAFRDLKYPLCLNSFHSKKIEYIEQEIWARAVLHNFCTAIILDVKVERRETKHEYQVNFSEAFKICRDFLRIHDAKTKMEVESLIAQNIEAIRLGRTFARQHRFHLPFRFCYPN